MPYSSRPSQQAHRWRAGGCEGDHERSHRCLWTPVLSSLLLWAPRTCLCLPRGARAAQYSAGLIAWLYCSLEGLWGNWTWMKALQCHTERGQSLEKTSPWWQVTEANASSPVWTEQHCSGKITTRSFYIRLNEIMRPRHFQMQSAPDGRKNEFRVVTTVKYNWWRKGTAPAAMETPAWRSDRRGPFLPSKPHTSEIRTCPGSGILKSGSWLFPGAWNDVWLTGDGQQIVTELTTPLST